MVKKYERGLEPFDASGNRLLAPTKNLPKGYRYQVVGRRAERFGNTGFSGGYDIILYKPKFGGFETRGRYLNLSEVREALRVLRKNIKERG